MRTTDRAGLKNFPYILHSSTAGANSCTWWAERISFSSKCTQLFSRLTCGDALVCIEIKSCAAFNSTQNIKIFFSSKFLGRDQTQVSFYNVFRRWKIQMWFGEPRRTFSKPNLHWRTTSAYTQKLCLQFNSRGQRAVCLQVRRVSAAVSQYYSPCRLLPLGRKSSSNRNAEPHAHIHRRRAHTMNVFLALEISSTRSFSLGRV